MIDKMFIKVEYSENGLFNGWDQLDSYDLAESAKVYGEKLEAVLRRGWPAADIEVVQTVNDQVRCSSDLEIEIPVIEAIVADIYRQHGWLIVLNKET